MEDKTVYFQPPGISPQFCEAGMISETDPEYIWYYNEPCKILISEVKIIPKEDVIYDKKKRSYLVSGSLPLCKHEFEVKDQYWSSCIHCGKIVPNGNDR